MSEMKYSFYTLIAYDYKYALNAISSYYDIADEIFLGLDKNRISWTGKKFDFDDDYFFDRIKKIDKDKKIMVIQSNFYRNKHSPLANETLERNFLSNYCKNENYVIGIDSDEYILNPKVLLDYSFSKDNDLKAIFHSVYKVIDEDKVLVTLPQEYSLIGTFFKGRYMKARMTSRSKKFVVCPLEILHYSWGRTREELIQKLQNWGHSKDVNHETFMKDWDMTRMNNYEQKRNFHPLVAYFWEKLKLINVEKLRNKW